jgi:tetratricopeptide (TPR) repeat protein
LSRHASAEQLERGLRKLEVDPDDLVTLSRTANAYAARGDGDKARELIDRIVEADPDEGLVLYNAACGMALLGERERMLTLLRLALERGFVNTLSWVRSDPDFRDYQDDPEFRAIVDTAHPD